MADSTPNPTPPPSTATNTVAKVSSFQRTVCLYDWWLILAKNDFHGKRLAVAGVSSKKDEAMRVFVSAPIIKRYDVFSLETADGIYVIISGFINKERTLENGFAPEVFTSFLFGFPPNWESYAVDCFRKESTAVSDSGNAVPDNVSAIRPEVLSEGNAVPDNVATTRPEISSDGNAVPDNVSTIRPEILSDGNAVPDNVSTIRPEILSDGNAVPDNVSVIHPEILSDDVGKPNPTSSMSPEETLGDHEKPFHKDESIVSKEMSGVSGGIRRSARLLSVKVCEKKNQPASGGPLKHLGKEQNSTSVALENCDGEGLKSYARGHIREEPTAGIDVGTATPDNGIVLGLAAPDNLPAIRLDRLFDDAEKSIPTSLVSPEEAPGDCEQPHPEDECNVLREIGGVKVAYGSGGKRRSARFHNIEDESNVSKKTGGDSGGNRRSARLHRVEVFQQKNQPASDGPLKHPDKEQSSPSVALENCDGVGLKSYAPGRLREEPTAGIDVGTSAPDNGIDVGTAAPDNLPVILMDRLFDDAEKSIPTSLVSPEEAPGDCEQPHPEDECNVLREIGGVKVANGSGGKRRSARFHNIEDESNVSKKIGGNSGGNRRSARLHRVEVFQQKNQPAYVGPLKHPDKEQSSPSVALENCDGVGLKSYAPGRLREEPTAGIDVGTSAPDNGIDVGTAAPDNLPVIRMDRLFDDAEKSIPTSLVSPEEAPGDCEQPLPEDECNVIAVGKPNPTYSISPDETLGDHEKPFHKDKSNVPKEMDGASVAYGSGGNRRSARLHSVKVCQKKNQLASGGPLKHLDKEKNSTSVAFENCDGEGLQSYARCRLNEESTAGIDVGTAAPDNGIDLGTAAPDNLPAIRLDRLFDDAEKSIPTYLVSPEEAPGDCEQPLPEDECSVLREIGGVNVDYASGGKRHSSRLHKIEDESHVSKKISGDSGSNRCSTRLHRVKVFQQKNQPASGGPLKHPGKEQSSPSVALENCNEDGLRSSVTPIQSQPKGLVNILSEQLVKKSTSRISSSMSAGTAGHYKKRRMAVTTKAVSPKRKITKSVSDVKSPQGMDLSHLNNRSNQKISCVSPESLSFKKSKSGRLLLPPLEFWRNQIPVYNADREVTEIQDGASLVSPCRGASPSLSRNSSNRNTKMDQQNDTNAPDGSRDLSLKRKRGRPRNYPKPDLEESLCPT